MSDFKAKIHQNRLDPLAGINGSYYLGKDNGRGKGGEEVSGRRS